MFSLPYVKKKKKKVLARRTSRSWWDAAAPLKASRSGIESDFLLLATHAAAVTPDLRKLHCWRRRAELR